MLPSKGYLFLWLGHLGPFLTMSAGARCLSQAIPEELRKHVGNLGCSKGGGTTRPEMMIEISRSITHDLKMNLATWQGLSGIYPQFPNSPQNGWLNHVKSINHIEEGDGKRTRKDIWHMASYGLWGHWYPISSRHLSLLRNGRFQVSTIIFGLLFGSVWKTCYKVLIFLIQSWVVWKAPFCTVSQFSTLPAI